MAHNYPLFENAEIKKKYTGKINDLLQKNDIDWTAYSSVFSSHIFVESKKDILFFNFPSIYRIGIYTKEGAVCLAINGLSSMGISPTKDIFEKEGYKCNLSPPPSNLCLFIKPLENLEEIVLELKKIERIIFKK